MKNVEFSTTPLRSVLKRLKSKSIKDSGSSHLKISRKMSSKDGVTKVYSGVLKNDSRNTRDYVHLDKSVREVIIEEFSLLSNAPGSSEIKKPDNEEAIEIKEPDNEIKELKIEEPKIEPKVEPKVEPKDEEDSGRVNISAKLDLLLKITARITTQVKKLTQPEVVEVMEDAPSLTIHADQSTSDRAT